ncbi:acyl-CoA dehydrogenase family protein [Jiangella alba]|uniref:Acyl-CoA dehydrogenase n=1 Tax=Jiangella alba TaxID=561176 RepID=A0A1H5K0W7_9ACTN|nr:acyl-CoA dehydrogenase [Jiangella alba]SEE58433.1 Acyl-CoA dehydrogenase [Jiangella alba]
MDTSELRRQDYTLDGDQVVLRDLFAQFFARECPMDVVRAAEPTGHDPQLWRATAELGAMSMALPAEAGGDGAGIVEVALLAEQLGRRIAPVPLVEHVVASRLLAAGGGDDPIATLLADASRGRTVLGLGLERYDVPQLVSSGAVAGAVVGHRAGAVVVSTGGPQPHAANQAGLPSAWRDLGAEPCVEVPVASTAVLVDRARRELKVLTAAALVGLTEGALALAVSFVQTRRTQGVPLGSLQGVSFPLADVAIGVAGARHLCRRAAWFLDHEPEAEPDLPGIAFAYAAEVATHGVTVALHAHGGLGFAVESDVSRYFLRAKGWTLAAGDPGRDVLAAGEALLAKAARPDREDRRWTSR